MQRKMASSHVVIMLIGACVICRWRVVDYCRFYLCPLLLPLPSHGATTYATAILCLGRVVFYSTAVATAALTLTLAVRYRYAP